MSEAPAASGSPVWRRPGSSVHLEQAKQHVLVYLGVGSISAVSSGLDRVTRLHWKEVSGSEMLVTGFVVDPTTKAENVESFGPSATLHTYPTESEVTRFPVLRKISALLWPSLLLKGLSLQSSQATKQARRLAAVTKPTLVIVDHIYAAQNLPIEWLWSRKIRFIFVAHDHMPSLIRDLYEDKRGLRRKISYLSDLIKSTMIEKLLLWRSDRIVFLSDHDQAVYPAYRDKSLSLLPFDEAPDDDASQGTPALPEWCTDDLAYVVFVGSPSFLPNRHALTWICEALSPALWKIAPACRIVLVGKGTSELSGESPNVIGCGFVSDGELEAILHASMALLSPIEHGSGLKIKVLDALAEGIPVIATKLSLQGFGKFHLPLTIRLDRPDDVANMISSLASGAIDTAKMRHDLSAQVKSYRDGRNGRLAALISDVIGKA